MNLLKRFILLFSFLYVTGCATVGPTLIIETPEPAEDFVVICKWGTTFNQAGTFDEDVHVIKSGEKLSCGFNLLGRASASMQHPIYTVGTMEVVDGVEIIKPITKLQRLDEIKVQFESGFWDESKWPGSYYADSVKGLCWFPPKYFNYYQKVKTVTLEHFKSLYYKDILQCYERVVPILKKYDKSYKDMKDALDYVEGFWVPKNWEQYDD